MKLLFIHQNFPGQYLHLARYLGSQAGHDVVFLTQRKNGALPGIRKAAYAPKRKPSRQTHLAANRICASVTGDAGLSPSARVSCTGSVEH